MASCLQKIPSRNESRARKEKMMKWVFWNLVKDRDWMMKKLRYKYYNKQITTLDNGMIQSRYQEERKFGSTIIVNSGVHTLIGDKN